MLFPILSRIQAQAEKTVAMVAFSSWMVSTTAVVTHMLLPYGYTQSLWFVKGIYLPLVVSSLLVGQWVTKQAVVLGKRAPYRLRQTGFVGLVLVVVLYQIISLQTS